MATRNSEAAEVLLDQEREALVGSDFNRLEKLLNIKEDLFAALESDRDHLTAEDLSRLRRATARNQRLQAATIRGLRSVIERLDARKRAAAHLDTYTAQGNKCDLVSPRSQLERKA
ncbi:MAG: hypothetical protein AAFQ66_20440 [Pseudomonadota bacterium]